MKSRTRRSIDPNTIQLIRQIVVGVLVFGFIGGLLLSTYYVTRIERFTIQSVEAVGGETIDVSRVAAAAEAELAGTYLGLVPKRFLLWYPESAMVAAAAAIPRVSEAVVTREDTTLTVEISEHIPVALWCGVASSSPCLFLDAGGYAFAEAPPLRGGAYTRYHTLGRAPTVGERPWEQADFATLEALVSILKDSGWAVAAVEVDAARDVFLRLAGGGEFKLTLDEPIATSIDNLLTIVRSDEFTHLEPGNFQYIDARFGNKIFINEETPTPPMGEGATSTDAVQATTSSPVEVSTGD